MTMLNDRRSSPLRMLVAPVALTLVSGSLLAGYARGQRNEIRALRGAEVPVVQFDPTNSTHRGAAGDPSAPAADAADDQAGAHSPSVDNDPVQSYKTAMELLKKDYYGANVDSRKTQELTYEAIRGMLFSLRDQFTSFLDPDEWNQMQATTHGDFEGIGAMLAEDKPDIKVVEPIETGPAEKAGIKMDDVIVRVNDVSVIGKDLNDVVRMIKGSAGTHVRITILRGKQTRTFNITRARVEPPVVKYWMEDPKSKIGHILLKEFNEKSMDQMNHAFSELQRQGMRALVFDLRYNPGGLLDVAIDVASVFIPRNSAPRSNLRNYAVIIREGSGHEQGRPLQAVDTAYSATRHVPTVVLVNESSASASEIVSGAIKDYGVATLIGERTYGKGRVQTLFPLDDGSALRLTTALYFPPRHKDLNFKRDEDGNRIPNTGGILPDIDVKQSDKWKSEDFKDKVNDTQLQVALSFLRARLSGEPAAQAVQQFQGHSAANGVQPRPDAGRTASAQPLISSQTAKP